MDNKQEYGKIEFGLPTAPFLNGVLPPGFLSNSEGRLSPLGRRRSIALATERAGGGQRHFSRQNLIWSNLAMSTFRRLSMASQIYLRLQRCEPNKFGSPLL